MLHDLITSKLLLSDQPAHQTEYQSKFYLVCQFLFDCTTYIVVVHSCQYTLVENNNLSLLLDLDAKKKKHQAGQNQPPLNLEATGNIGHLMKIAARTKAATRNQGSTNDEEQSKHFIFPLLMNFATTPTISFQTLTGQDPLIRTYRFITKINQVSHNTFTWKIGRTHTVIGRRTD